METTHPLGKGPNKGVDKLPLMEQNRGAANKNSMQASVKGKYPSADQASVKGKYPSAAYQNNVLGADQTITPSIHESWDNINPFHP